MSINYTIKMMLSIKTQKNNKPKSNNFIRRNIVKEQIITFNSANNVLKIINTTHNLLKN